MAMTKAKTKMELHEENVALRDAIAEANTKLLEILIHLETNKFNCGSQLDGYIATLDVRNRILSVSRPLRDALDDI